MTDIQSQIADIQSQLEAAYPQDEAQALAWWIMEEETGLSRSQLLFGHKGTTNFSNMQIIIDRLLHFEPIQYIFGHTLWYGLDLKVTPATLIPRPETAELIDLIGTCRLTESNERILDIGTGSGCIAIALKRKHPSWQVTGIDISAEAIEVAKENARRNGVDVQFRQMDLFSDEIESFIHSFDIIVSNPPYIMEKEKRAMRPNVVDYEPASALFVPDDDPLLFYRRIASLHPQAHLFFEINEALGAQMKNLLQNEGYTDVRIMPDIYGKERMIEAHRPNHAS